ncbi:hypothetical protein M4951_10480 [Blastopirellula sp. J2-11]|uniref:tetratricopeptide repeat protein n=1 Tax=Blastopirellula sp. J2-11 TaxID=2943192 RepID=UPI0021C78765|nr:tetratricopeptide repeat protein [Blastopirellula sp. J2-11]UUO08721.1 hypothetical protein M4951_10480 [Blastopirellula sp. J2-11]
MRFLLWSMLLLPAYSILLPVAWAEGESAEQLSLAARVAVTTGKHARAVELATLALEKDSQIAAMYYLRGREQFRLGRIAESAADFDKYAQLQPQEKPKLWERGITLYYAGRFQEGADQFALYQKYLSNDVENAAWRFLCMAQADGVDKAKAELLPIAGDGRVPMMTLYRFYRGQATEQQVLDEVEADEIGATERAGRRFHAALYLGLYHEATGQDDKAAPYLAQAASKELQETAQGAINGYMADVARIHWARKQAAEKDLND